MNKTITEKLTTLLKKQVDKFEESIKKNKEYEIEGHRGFKSSPVFPIFPIDDDTYYLIDKYNEIINDSLETFVIRDFIILALLEKGLDVIALKKYENVNYKNGKRCVDRNGYRGNFSYLIKKEDHYDAYIIEKSNSTYYVEDFINYEVMKFRENKINIENVFHLDFSNYEHCNFDYLNDDKNNIHHTTIKIKEFIENEFGLLFVEEYIDSINNAITKATNIIGYKSIPKLTSNYLYVLKNNVKRDLNNIDVLNLNYRLINKENRVDLLEAIENTTNVQSIFAQIKTMSIACKRLENNIFECLFGESNFAKAFLTSEYLFLSNQEKRIFENKDTIVSNDNYSAVMDFTPIISGYAKSVELLLYKVLEWYMDSESYDFKNRKYFYSNKNYYYDTEENIKNNKSYNKDEKTIIIKNIKKEVAFIEDTKDINQKKDILVTRKYEKYFNTSLGSLYNFLLSKDNDLMHVPEDEKSNEESKYLETIKKCFKLYTSECRNAPFHRGLIKAFNDVVNIRENTIYIIYLILLSVKVPFEEKELKNKLECKDDKFEIYYHYIVTYGERKFFKFHYSNTKSKIVYLIKINDKFTKYDENGFVINNPLCFIEFDTPSISEDEYNLFMYVKTTGDISLIKNRIVLFDREHCPDRIEKFNYRKDEEKQMIVKDSFVNLFS